MLIPYWQLDPTDTKRIAMAIHHQIAIDADTGAYLWSGRQPGKYGITIPASDRADNVYLRFRANSDAEAFVKGTSRLAKWQASVKSNLLAAHRTALRNRAEQG